MHLLVCRPGFSVDFIANDSWNSNLLCPLRLFLWPAHIAHSKYRRQPLSGFHNDWHTYGNVIRSYGFWVPDRQSCCRRCLRSRMGTVAGILRKYVVRQCRSYVGCENEALENGLDCCV